MNQENNGLVTVIPRLFSIPFAPSDSSNTNFTSNLNGIENLQRKFFHYYMYTFDLVGRIIISCILYLVALAGSSLLGTPDSSFQLKNSPSNSTMRGKPQDAGNQSLLIT